MNHGLLKRIILDQHAVIKDAEIVSRRFSFEKNGNYILVGLRRAGKSTMLYKRARELVESGVHWNRIIYINFEDERLGSFSADDFNDILSVQAELSDEKGYFFFDEIQNIEGWERFARRMADSKEHISITGSNARMLSVEIEARLGGRYLSKYIPTYRFDEYLSASSIPHSTVDLIETKAQARIVRAFDDYLYHGGLPESLCFRNKREYISSVYQKVLLGDIIVRNGIRNHEAVRLLINKLAISVKDELSFSKLHGMLRSYGSTISKDSVIEYIGNAIDAFLIFPIRNYYYKFLDQQGIPKYYFSDNGILGLFLDDRNTNLLENLAAISLVDRYSQDGVYYIKSQKTGIDIDFYVPAEEMLIQVAYSLSSTSEGREIMELRKAARLIKGIKRLIIFTHDEERIIEEEGVMIEVIPLWKWLLSDDRIS